MELNDTETGTEQKKTVKDVDREYIAKEEAKGYDYSKKPESYSSWDWCGQCNRSLKSWDDERCDCLD
jgi:hypothetical protein